MTYFAHSENPARQWHPLQIHLAEVARLSRSRAANAPWAGEAELAGLLHDLGKYADRFQRRLTGQDAGLDHWSQGAWIALANHKAIAAALAIQGHHVGLQRGSTQALRDMQLERLAINHPQRLQLSDPDADVLLRRAVADGLEFHPPIATALKNGVTQATAAMLDVRLLFSCLVDADFLDTEAHFNGDIKGKHHRLAGPTLNAGAALAALNRYMTERVRAATNADAQVRRARETLWRATGDAAREASNVFTLTAPTGSGKTLAMLRFALEHAAKNNLRRIVLAVPFLTVIEQTAREYRKVFAGFPHNFVLEHHSLAGLGEESEQKDAEGVQERQRRLLAENWDAPIVLTTNVQLLESLFSNRPSSCRKLHSLMESVILFDEAQSLPQHLAVPTLAALSHLSQAYRSTVVFATATQPAFDTLHEAIQKQATKGWKPVELVPDHPHLFEALKRVQVTWPEVDEMMSWAGLAAQIRSSDQVLVVVNLKRHAFSLLDALREDTDVFHLSTNLCAEHRRAVLDKVRSRLKAGQRCRLISTQCVEAGVDVDFPKVYRAMAPLDAIAQAAGRCNREGRMNALGQHGQVIVFRPADEEEGRRAYPTFAYYQAAQVTQALYNRLGGLDINDPAIFRAYYQSLYDLNDPALLNPDLMNAISALDFVEVASRYKLIDQDAIQVLVPWADGQGTFQSLLEEAESDGISAAWMRRAQGVSVSIYRPRAGVPAWAIPAKLRRGGVSDEWFILEGDYYDNTLGLSPPDGPQVFIA
ncbi:MAG: CRISPR-associated helicase Cas3' [Pseudomonadota bacterium]